MRPVVEPADTHISAAWRLGLLASWRLILLLIVCLILGPIGCETMTQVQNDFDDGVARGFHELDNVARHTDDTTHRWRHGY